MREILEVQVESTLFKKTDRACPFASELAKKTLLSTATNNIIDRDVQMALDSRGRAIPSVESDNISPVEAFTGYTSQTGMRPIVRPLVGRAVCLTAQAGCDSSNSTMSWRSASVSATVTDTVIKEQRIKATASLPRGLSREEKPNYETE